MKQIVNAGNKGFTLVEILISLALASVLLAAVYAVYQGQLKGQIAQEASLDLQQEMRSAMMLMEREIRTAGMDPTGKAGAAILVAKPDELRFTRDIVDSKGNSGFDGLIDGPNEDIRYAVNSMGNLGRDTCNPAGAKGFNCSGLQSILDGVDILNFVYFDSKGDRLYAADLQTKAGIGDIRHMQITIVASCASSGRGLPAGFVDSHMYKNQSGKPLVQKPFGDNKRRMKMMSAVALRNTGAGN